MVQDAAGAAGTRKAVIQLAGLNCPSCVARIEGAVRRMEGVQKAQLHFVSQRLTAELKGISADQVAAVVRELGYRVVSAREGS